MDSRRVKRAGSLGRSRIFTALCALFYCATTAVSLAADSGYIVDVWTTESEPPRSENTMPENAIIAMTQTSDGYLWLGTYGGHLVRFDGIRFESFDESNTPGLESSPIVYLFEDSHKNLWLGTQGGVILIKDGHLAPLSIGSHTREGRLAAACEDSEGAVWLYMADGKLFRYRNGEFAVANVETLGNYSACRTMVAEKSGLVWVGTDTRMFGFNPKAIGGKDSPLEELLEIPVPLDLLVAGKRGGYWRLAGGEVQKWNQGRLERDLGPYPWKGRHIINSACEDQEGNLVVGTFGEGVWIFDAEGKTAPAQISPEQGLSHNTVLSVCVDREDTLWVGTDGGGLDRVKRKVFGVAPETMGKTVQSVCADGQGGVLFGKYGGGLARLEGQSVQAFGANQSFMIGAEIVPATNLIIRSVFVDHNQQIWAAAEGMGLLQVKKGQFSRIPGAERVNPHISAIYEDGSNHLWLGTQTGLALWNGEATSNVWSGAVRAIVADAKGNLWIGMDGGGLDCLRDGQFSVFHKTDGLPSEHVTALFVDKEDVLWVGTSSGLARFQDGKWTRYSTQEGLAGNGIYYITEDDQDNLWIGSNAGLMRVAKPGLSDFAKGRTNYITCRSFGTPDGLPTRECSQGSQPATCRTSDGKLWFATIRGLVFVNPADLKLNTNPPPVVIESVLVDDKRQTTSDFRGTPPREIIIPPGAEALEIHYTSLNLTAPDKARFRYIMEGDQKKWTPAGDTRMVRYPKLPPGEYHFKVTACNEDGVWNETGASLGITVLPPFWRKPWFIGVMTACFLGLIVGVVHYFSTQRLQRQLEGLRQQQALEKERSRIARDIHDQLGASLTQVSLLGEMVESDKNSPDEVEAHARQISQTARDTSHALDEIVWTVNPSNDTVEGLVNYVCKYAQEYLAVAGLRYRLDVPSQLPAAGISPEVRHNVFLASKEAITNVVRHARATEVWLRLRLEPQGFTLEIQDNGKGPSGLEGKQSRNGLRNMHKRMEDIGGTFAITAAPGGGALVRLTVPLGKH